MDNEKLQDIEAEEKKETVEPVVEETSNWETLTEEDEKYIERMEHPEDEKAEDATTEETTDVVERPVIDQAVAEKVAQEEKDSMGKELGMKFHSIWVSFGLPLVVMWAGLDALMAAMALIQGNGSALANVLIRGAVLFFGIPCMKGIRKFERKAYIKHLTLCFYSLAVKVVNIVMVVLNYMAAPSVVSDMYASQQEQFVEKGITEAMLIADLNMQLMITTVINVVTFVLWIAIYFYYKKRRKYFKYKSN